MKMIVKFQAWIVALLGCVLAGLLQYWRYGYHEVASDLYILDLKGMQAADPGILVNDWFTSRVPQPHWIYDKFVELFFGFGVLAEAKFVAYSLSIVMVVIAAMLLIRAIGGSLWYGVLFLVILITGPTSILGSSTLLFGWSLPHGWGSAAALLTLAVAMTGYWRVANLMVLFVPILHSQHGLHIGFIFLIAGFYRALIAKDRSGYWAGFAGLSAMTLALTIAKLGAVAGLTSSFDRICKLHAPFHCFSSWWPGPWWVPALFVVPGVILCLVHFWKIPRLRVWSVTLGLIGLGYSLALGIEYFDIEPLSLYVRMVNAWRWITIFAPIAILGYLTMLQWTSKFKWLLFAVPTWILLTWQAGYSGSWETVARMPLIGIAIGGTLIALLASLKYRQAIIAVWLGANVVGIGIARPEFGDESFLRGWGEQIEKAVPAGEILIANPYWLFLRHTTHRAVIADIKGIPYDYPYLTEWEVRVADLGAGNYTQMTYEQWIATARKYGAKYGLVVTTDRFFEEARAKNEYIFTLPNSGTALYRLTDVGNSP